MSMIHPSHLSLYQSVDNGLQRLMPVAGQYSLKVLRAVLQGFGHCHIQVVVCFFCCQILFNDKSFTYDVYIFSFLDIWFTKVFLRLTSVQLSAHYEFTFFFYTYDNIKFWVYVYHSTCKTEKTHNELKFQRFPVINVIPTSTVFQPGYIPLSSTTGSADTRCSTKIPSAVYRGVSARTMAMFWNVPIFSSSKVWLKNEGLGISDILKQKIISI